MSRPLGTNFMNTKIIIQARAGSSRLPNKVLLPFVGNKTILQVILENLLKEFSNDQLIVATTTSVQDDRIVELVKAYHINLFRGNESDVLNRFIECARAFNTEGIIRVCADNPFLLPKYIKTLIREAGPNDDYLSFAFPDNIPVIMSHIGLFAEYTTLNALNRVESLTDSLKYREHVTNYIYSHPEIFSVRFIELPVELAQRRDIRLTVDSQEDFEILKELYKVLPDVTDDNFLKSLIFHIDSSLTIKNRMKKQILKYEK